MLGLDEPAPFTIVNPSGRSPFLLTCDHASNFIPRAFECLGVEETELSRHIGYDIGIAEVTRGLAERLDAPAVLSHFSRLVVDPNRRPEARSSILEVSDHTPVPGNRDLTPAEREARLATFFQPYHNAVARMIASRRAMGIAPALLMMHSFTPSLDGVRRPWDVCMLSDRDRRLADRLIEALAGKGLKVGDNVPYSGTSAVDYGLHAHGEIAGLACTVVEIRQDLIDTHHGAEAWMETLFSVLCNLAQDATLFEAREELPWPDLSEALLV